jgi:hypothetical protein
LAEEAAKVAAVKAAEEKQKREDRVAVTKGLTDNTTMKQLLSAVCFRSFYGIAKYYETYQSAYER